MCDLSVFGNVCVRVCLCRTVYVVVCQNGIQPFQVHCGTTDENAHITDIQTLID